MQVANESEETSIKSSYVQIPPQSERHFQTQSGGQLLSNGFVKFQGKKSSMNVFD